MGFILEGELYDRPWDLEDFKQLLILLKEFPTVNNGNYDYKNVSSGVFKLYQYLCSQFLVLLNMLLFVLDCNDNEKNTSRYEGVSFSFCNETYQH